MWYLMLVLSIWIWGFLWGCFVYLVLASVLRHTIKDMVNLEMMNGSDEVFFLDDHRN